MDRITKSYLNEFTANFTIEEIETTAFEHFVNYSLIDNRVENSYDVEDLNIGGNGTIGIDGFAIIINGHLILTIEELEDFLLQNKKCTAEVIFIQSKTSSKFEIKDIGNFGFSVTDFISENSNLKWSDIAIEKINLFNSLIDHVKDLKENPVCSLYYTSLGQHNEDTNIKAKQSNIIKSIQSESLFSQIDFEFIDASELQTRYKKIGQAIERTFEFESRLTLPELKGAKEAYLGIVKCTELLKLITTDNKTVIPNIFYDNVRDYQGKNAVNKEISVTLNSEDSESFVLLNNGVTIVAESLITTRNSFTLNNYQIINGCQTSHVLFENSDVLSDNIYVPLKLVISKDGTLTSKMIRSTNRQTEVKEQDLICFDPYKTRVIF